MARYSASTARSASSTPTTDRATDASTQSLRHRSWDKSTIFLVDQHTGVVLQRLYPLDKVKNASGRRRPITPREEATEPSTAASGMAPLLRQLMADYAETGLPPAYLKKETP